MPLDRRALLWPPVLFLLLFFAYPLMLTLREAVASPQAADAWRWMTTDYVTTRIGIAFTQAALSLVLTLAIAMPLAWHHHRRRLPFGRVHRALHAAPFVLPVFVVIFGIRETFGTGGLTHTFLGLDVLTWGGPLLAVVLAHAYYNYGFAARLLHAALERRPHHLEDAARALGATRWQAFRRTSLPLLWPSALATALLVFLFCFTSFGVVLFLGGRSVATLETLLYAQLGGVYPQTAKAAVLGVSQLGINVLLLGGYLALRRRAAAIPAAPPRPALPARPVDHAIQWGALALGVLPALSVLIGAFHIRGQWTLEAWRALLSASHPSHLAGFEMGRVVLLSLYYAGWAVVLSILLTLLLGYGLRRLGTWPRRLADAAAALPLGTSSLLLGFGYVLAFASAGAWPDLRGTATIIILVHTLVAFPFTARILLPALDGHDRRLDEAAAVLGAPPWHIIRRVHLPVLIGPVIVAAGLAAAMSLGDFGASLLLMQQDTMSLAVWIDAHDQPFRPLMKAQATALAAVLMLVAAAVYGGAEALRRGDP